MDRPGGTVIVVRERGRRRAGHSTLVRYVLMAEQAPLTTEPSDPKNDEIPLMGLAASFFVREHQGSSVLEFEIFHL